MKNLRIVKTEEEFELVRLIQKLIDEFGGFEKDIIREYIIKDLTPELAYDLWYNDQITFAELQYVKKLKGLKEY